MEELLTPAQMAQECGVSLDTLRYYEREGLLAAVERTGGGVRRYRREDVEWLQVLRCLRVTAMPVRRLRRFAELVRAGDEALPERLELLRAHRRDVVDKLAELKVALEMIDHKIEVYARLVAADGHPPVALGGQPPTGRGQATAGRGQATAGRGQATAGRGGPARQAQGG